MNLTLRTALSAGLLAVPMAVLAPAEAHAAPAQPHVYVEDYDGHEAVEAEENACGDWDATLFEKRSGQYKLVEAPGGELHVNGVVHGQVRLVPNDPALPTYGGSYREKINAIITGVDENGDDVARVAQYRLRLAMTGSDGSELLLVESGKVTFTPAGEAVVTRELSSCRPG